MKSKKITIFWFAWSWTTTIWKLLAEKLDIKFMSSWNIMRNWAQDIWYNIYDFEENIIKNDNWFDLKLDKKVELFWKQNNDFIFESRLAWHFILDSFKIYLKCDNYTRYLRIKYREWLDLDQIIEKTKKRENKLVKRYNKIYKNIDFPPKEENFDLIIDVTKIYPQEIIDIIIKKLNYENTFNKYISWKF